MKFNDFKRKVAHLPVFSSSALAALTEKPEASKVQLSLWKKRGLVQVLRKGLYVLPPEERRIEPGLFYLANQIYAPSYVSLESALSHYGLIPEFVRATTSVTARKTRRFENAFGIFSYRHVMPNGYGGFVSVKESSGLFVLMASPEKALVDFLYYNLSKISASDRKVFKASFRFQNCGDLKIRTLKGHAAVFGVSKLQKVADNFIKEMIA